MRLEVRFVNVIPQMSVFPSVSGGSFIFISTDYKEICGVSVHKSDSKGLPFRSTELPIQNFAPVQFLI